MKISTKLALGFGSLIVFIAIISFLSLSNMSKLNNSVQELANDRFPKVVWSNNIIDAINDAARSMRMLVILNTEEYAAESTNNRKRIEDAATKASQNIDSLKATIFSDEAKALLSKLEISRQNYYNSRKGFLSLIDQKRFAEAGVYLAKDLRQPQQEYFDSIQELINFFGNQFKDDAMQAQSTYSASFNLILILVIASILIAIILAVYIIRNITKSIQQGVTAAEAISHGDMSTNIDVSSKDEVGILMAAMKAMSENIQAIINEVNKSAQMAQDGKLDYRANASKFEGEYKQLLVSFNAALDALIRPMNMTAEYVDRISKGDIPPKITEEYKGDFNEIKNNLNATIDVMSGLLQDTNGLIKASIEGKLDTRANASKYIGGWNELVAGINELINALVKPINVTAEYVDRISKGDIPPKITEEYKGDFNEIKNNLNGTIDVMNSLTGEIQSLIENAVTGNLSFRANAKIFIGSWSELVGGINKLLDNIVDPINEASHAVSILATGDLRARMEGNYKGDLAKLKNDINTLADSLSALINEVNNTVEQVASAATQMSATSDTLAAGTQEQSAQTDDVASAVEEMSRTITENAMGATRTSEVAHKNGELANQGGAVVQQTVQKMTDIAKVVGDSAITIQKLGESSKQIGEIISVIDDIADQTNLLALNAAIEAARAGEQGRGFAVVADEVRKLAERTTDATKQIANMIRGIQKETDMAVVAMNQGNDEVKKGIELADRAGQSLGDILSSTKELLEMINQIAAASEEQSATSEEISKNVISISKVIAESSRRVEDVAHASDDMAKLTERLRNLMMQFKIDGGGAFSAPSSPKNYSLSSSSASKRQLQTSSAAVAPSYNAPSETGSVWD